MSYKGNKLLRLSVLLIIVIVFLVIASLFLFLQQLGNQTTDGTIINIAGRQRMLSQKITKNCLIISKSCDSLPYFRSKQELCDDLLNIKNNYQIIKNRKNPQSIEIALNELTPKYNLLIINAEKIFCVKKDNMQEYLKQINDVEPLFLRDMNRIVNLYENNYVEKQLRFKRFIIFSNITMIIILFSIVLFVIIPEINKNDLINKKQEKLVSELTILNHTKNTFFKIIAHDLKNPFTSIIGLTDLLKENYTTYNSEEILSSLDIINSQAKNTFDLLNNLLNWARIQTGEIAFNPTKVQVQDIFSSLENEMKYLACLKSITLLFPDVSKISVFADANMLKTVLRNLITNALKFSTKHSEVKVSCIEHSDSIEFIVSDSGIGLSADNAQKLFRIETTFTTRGTEDEAGTGLGLILCKEFINRHKGKIWIESELGKGSDFKFTIPKTTT